MVDELIAGAPETVDLNNPAHLKLAMVKAKLLEQAELNESELKNLRERVLKTNSKSSTIPLLAIKLVRSKRIVDEINTPLKVSIVFAVYKEHNRIRTSAEHPHGEDFLNRKVAQLNWLFAESKVNWELILVDDGCPENSGGIAQEIIAENGMEEQVSVLFLKDAIDNKLLISKGLKSTDGSRKGGSIIYGMWSAVRNVVSNNHIVVYTDADLSTHLGQIGLLLDPIVNSVKSVAIGTRRAENSVVVKQGSRNNRGKLFIYLWKRLLPELSYIVDTQCGFKAFRSETLKSIVENMIERKFAFDIELLLKSEQLKPNSIAKVGIAWIDSEAASTTTDLQPYLPMLKAIASMYRKYSKPNLESDKFADLIERITEDEFQILLDNIPEGITRRKPSEFSDFYDIHVSDLEEAMRIS